jgi:hypothetical protein
MRAFSIAAAAAGLIVLAAIWDLPIYPGAGSPRILLVLRAKGEEWKLNRTGGIEPTFRPKLDGEERNLLLLVRQ